jgi:hypothetical protein
VATTGTTRAEEGSLPQSATITIREQQPYPPGEVEVTPDAGRIHFKNEDKDEYRLRFWKVKTDPDAGIDILLPAGGSVTVVIKKNDEFDYSVMHLNSEDRISTNGPIKN